MLLLHATPSRNLNSILKAGLLTAKSRGRRPAVWAAAPGRASWCLLHVCRKHHTPAERVILLQVDIPRRWLRRCKVRGLWFCRRDILPDRILGVVTFQELARSPVEESAAAGR
jgi:hypothetical protein